MALSRSLSSTWVWTLPSEGAMGFGSRQTAQSQEKWVTQPGDVVVSEKAHLKKKRVKPFSDEHGGYLCG